MARIRTIKPEFFRHEALQDLETANPGQHVMLVFAALWGHCDKEGRFLWKPRTMKLDILPFLDFDLGASLMLLREAGLIQQYEVDGVLYGFVPTFKEHQRISGKESQESAKYPEPKGIIPIAPQGSDGEASGRHLESQEGKGREKEGKGNNNTDVLFVVSDAADHDAGPERSGKPACPHKEIVALYHELLPASPEIRDWTPARAAVLRTRWNEAPERQNLDWWRRFFGYISESDFLTGKAYSPDRKPFCAPLEWILKAENFAKIREGRYHQEAA